MLARCGVLDRAARLAGGAAVAVAGWQCRGDFAGHAGWAAARAQGRITHDQLGIGVTVRLALSDLRAAIQLAELGDTTELAGAVGVVIALKCVAGARSAIWNALPTAAVLLRRALRRGRRDAATVHAADRAAATATGRARVATRRDTTTSATGRSATATRGRPTGTTSRRAAAAATRCAAAATRSALVVVRVTTAARQAERPEARDAAELCESPMKSHRCYQAIVSRKLGTRSMGVTVAMARSVTRGRVHKLVDRLTCARRASGVMRRCEPRRTVDDGLGAASPNKQTKVDCVLMHGATMGRWR